MRLTLGIMALVLSVGLIAPSSARAEGEFQFYCLDKMAKAANVPFTLLDKAYELHQRAIERKRLKWSQRILTGAFKVANERGGDFFYVTERKSLKFSDISSFSADNGLKWAHEPGSMVAVVFIKNAPAMPLA